MRHQPELAVRVLKRSADGRPTVVEHYCSQCGRLISNWKCVGVSTVEQRS